jgi:endonuclease YncB( thermonuclease family)
MIKPLLLAMGLISLASAAQAEDLSGIIRAAVSDVVDGDTIIIEQSGMPFRIDLESIDAPELNQAYGQESKDFLSSLIKGKNITVQQVKTVDFRHITGFVKLEDLEINRKMISSGMAWYDGRNGYDAQLEDVQKTAKSAKIGLWHDKKSIAPWDYRAGPKDAFKLPDIAVSYDPEPAAIAPDSAAPAATPATEVPANNVKLDQVLGAKVPAFTPPPPPPAKPGAKGQVPTTSPLSSPAPTAKSPAPEVKK